jgi:hypothetical protein
MLDPDIDRPTSLFTGVPVIGSLCFSCISYNPRFIEDERFALEFRHRKYVLFTRYQDKKFQYEIINVRIPYCLLLAVFE